MKLSSRFVASSAVAILSTALLCGTAMSQTTPGSASLPTVTIEAPKLAAKPHAPKQETNRAASRRTTGSSTAQAPSFAPDSVLGKIAKLEKASSNCNGGCETSYRVGNAPWVGCSYSGGEVAGVGPLSSTCRDTLTHNTYLECRDTKILLGSTPKEARWLCSSLQAGGKLAGEKPQIAEVKQAGRR